MKQILRYAFEPPQKKNTHTHTVNETDHKQSILLGLVGFFTIVLKNIWNNNDKKNDDDDDEEENIKWKVINWQRQKNQANPMLNASTNTHINFEWVSVVGASVPAHQIVQS